MISKWMIIYSLLAHFTAEIPSTVQESPAPKLTKNQRFSASAKIAGCCGIIYLTSSELANALVNSIHLSRYSALIANNLFEAKLQEDIQITMIQNNNSPNSRTSAFMDIIYNLRHARENEINRSLKTAQEDLFISILMVPILYLHIKKALRYYELLRDN